MYLSGVDDLVDPRRRFVGDGEVRITDPAERDAVDRVERALSAMRAMVSQSPSDLVANSEGPDYLIFNPDKARALIAQVEAHRRDLSSAKQQLADVRDRLFPDRAQYRPDPSELPRSSGTGPSPGEGISVCGGVLSPAELRNYFAVRDWCSYDAGPGLQHLFSGDDTSSGLVGMMHVDPAYKYAVDSYETQRPFFDGTGLEVDRGPLTPDAAGYSRVGSMSLGGYDVLDVTEMIRIPPEVWEFHSRDDSNKRYRARIYNRTFWLGDDLRARHIYYRVGTDHSMEVFGGVVMALAGGMAAAAIGPAVMGAQFTAAYPAAAKAVGAMAVQTVLSGGDVETSIKNAATSLLAAELAELANAGVSAVIDVDFVGKAAAVATQAMLTGGDPENAVLALALQSGVEAIGDVVSGSGDTVLTAEYDAPTSFDTGDAAMPPIDFSSFTGSEYGDFVEPAPAFEYTVEPFGSVDSLVPGSEYSLPAPGAFYPGSFPVETDYGFGPFTSDGGIQTYDAAPVFGETSAPSFADLFPMPGEDFQPQPYVFGGVASPGYQQPAPDVGGEGGLLNTVTDLALAAIKINAAYQATQRPPVRTATTSPGVTRTPNANGTLTTTNVLTGQTAVTMPERGVPYVLPDGRIVINNGNGTYSVTGANGATQTLRYSTTAAGGSPNYTPWLIGAGALALLALR